MEIQMSEDAKTRRLLAALVQQNAAILKEFGKITVTMSRICMKMDGYIATTATKDLERGFSGAATADSAASKTRASGLAPPPISSNMTRQLTLLRELPNMEDNLDFAHASAVQPLSEFVCNLDALLNSVPGLDTATTSATFPVSSTNPATAAAAAADAPAPLASVVPVASSAKSVTFEIPAAISTGGEPVAVVLTANPPKKSNGGRPRKRKESTPSGSNASKVDTASSKRRKIAPSSTRTPFVPLWGSGFSKRKRVYFFGSFPTESCQISDIKSDADSFFIGDEMCRIYAANMQTIYQTALCLDAVQHRKEISVCKSVGDANKKVWRSAGSGNIKEFLADFKIGEPSGKVTKFNFHNCADCTAAPGNGSTFSRQSNAFLETFLSKFSSGPTNPVAGDSRRTIYLVGHACYHQEKNKTRDPDGVYVHFRILYRILQYGYNSLSIETLMRGISKVGDYPPVCYTYCSCKSKPEGCNATECVPGFSELPSIQQINEFNDKYAQHPEIELVHPHELASEDTQEKGDAAESIVIEETNADAMDTTPSAGMTESWPSPHEEFEGVAQAESPISDLYARYGIEADCVPMDMDPITVSGAELDDRFVYDEPLQGF